MIATIEIHGICSVCKSGSTCTLHHGRRILQCEQFEPFDINPVRTNFKSFTKQNNTQAKTVAGNTNPGKFKGLCKSCENRDACTFPKADSGVWHCEEYQ